MTPRTPRVATRALLRRFGSPRFVRSGPARLVIALLTAALMPAALAACTASPAHGGDAAGISPSVSEPAPTEPSSPSPTAEPTPTPGPTRPTSNPTASGTPTPTPTPTRTLAEWIALLPKFPDRPTPVLVPLSRAEGRSAWLHEIPTSQPVAFLTIDDGYIRKPEAIALLQAAHVPVTLFPTTNAVRADPDYFRALQAAGAVIEDHTISHPDLTGLSYEAQKKQLCPSADELGGWFGQRPIFFRPPFGEKNDDTLRAGWDCGLIAAFHWRETVNAGIVRYQREDHTIHAGDIILMHFRATFEADFVAALQAIKAAGLTPALLEEYVTLPGTP